MIGLWPLFNPDTFRSSGLNFGKKKGSVHFQYSFFIEILRELAPNYIKWPDARERQIIATEFEERYGYPGAIGCIDGVNRDITAPLEHPQAYVNRHHRYSMLVQAVCDHRLVYRDVYCGEPGAIGDVRNYDNSDLAVLLLTQPDMIDPEQHLLGDGIYTLSSKVAHAT